MKAFALSMLVACRGDWVPPVADGTYKVETATLPAADGEASAQAVVFDDKGSEVNQLGLAIYELTGLAVPLPTVSLDVQLAIKDEAVSFVNAGQVGPSLPFEAHDNDAFATGGAVSLTLTFAGYDPVQLAVTKAAVLLEPNSVQGSLGGLVSLDEIETKVEPIATDILNEILARDCTLVQTANSLCGCRTNTDGGTLASILGACTVTDDSFHTVGLLQSLLAPYPAGFLSLGMKIATERQ